MLKKDVKANLLEHSEAKVRLLNKYLQRYLNIIANDNYSERIKIFDLFCGEGIYENGGEGSPLIILKEVQNICSINRNKGKQIPNIDCQFNDSDENKINKLVGIVKNKFHSYEKCGKLEFTVRDYQEEIKRLCNELPLSSREKSFIFIDPYGYKDIKVSVIKSLLSKGNVEILLFLPTQFMYRFDANGTPEALQEFIEEIVDYKSWKETDSVFMFIDQLRIAFKDYLGKPYFVDTFTIQKDPKTVFCLFFFSSHIRGYEKMLEAKWEIDSEEGKGWDYTQNAPTLFYDSKTNFLEECLVKILQTRELTNGEIYELALHYGFLPKHANEVLLNLQKMNKLIVMNQNGEGARKGAFYINYLNYKTTPRRVKIKIKKL